MDMKERIRHLCKLNHVSMNKVEGDLGFGKGYLSKLGTSKPNAEKLKKIADYFNVSLDFIMTGKEDEQKEKDNTDLKQKYSELEELLRSDSMKPVRYDGKPVNNDTIEIGRAHVNSSHFLLSRMPSSA